MPNRPLEEWEYPEPDDDDEDSGGASTQSCPACGADVYEEADQCPACGEYIVFSQPPLAGRPWWFVALGLIGILAVIWALSRGW